MSAPSVPSRAIASTGTSVRRLSDYLLQASEPYVSRLPYFLER